jgi:phosphotransferase system HPr (HPr) family protein
VKLVLPDALHARPANLLVRVASEHPATVRVAFGGRVADAKSIIDVLALGAARGDAIDLEVSGDGASDCERALVALVEGNFDADLVPDTGEGAVAGVAVGRARVLDDAAPADDAPITERFARARRELEALVASLPERERALFVPELAILADLEPRVRARVAAGEAIRDAVVAETTLTQTDLFLDARARLLGDVPVAHAGDGTEIVVVARVVAPSLVASLPPSVVGLVSGRGDAPTHGSGGTSHAAILARSRGIPMAFVDDAIVDTIPDGDMVVLDTTVSPARVWVDPSAKLLAEARARCDELARAEGDRRARLAELAARAPVAVRVNVSAASEPIPEGAAGVGLVRTELVFASSRRAPSRVEQGAAYRAITAAGRGAPVTIRLFDAGGDKPVEWLSSSDAELRGVALLFEHPSVLEEQLAAIAEARDAGPARALVPLVAGPDDVRRVRALAPPGLPIGAMIETREAVAEVDAIAAVSDFLSVGTNDLTASILGGPRAGADRGLDPRVLDAVAAIVRAARAHGREVTVCGELAAHPVGGRRLAALGVTALSVAVPAFASVLEGLAVHSTPEGASS